VISEKSGDDDDKEVEFENAEIEAAKLSDSSSDHDPEEDVFPSLDDALAKDFNIN
jgi:hypothetical protein